MPSFRAFSCIPSTFPWLPRCGRNGFVALRLPCFPDSDYADKDPNVSRPARMALMPLPRRCLAPQPDCIMRSTGLRVMFPRARWHLRPRASVRRLTTHASAYPTRGESPCRCVGKRYVDVSLVLRLTGRVQGPLQPTTDHGGGCCETPRHGLCERWQLAWGPLRLHLFCRPLAPRDRRRRCGAKRKTSPASALVTIGPQLPALHRRQPTNRHISSRTSKRREPPFCPRLLPESTEASERGSRNTRCFSDCHPGASFPSISLLCLPPPSLSSDRWFQRKGRDQTGGWGRRLRFDGHLARTLDYSAPAPVPSPCFSLRPCSWLMVVQVTPSSSLSAALCLSITRLLP